MTSPYDKTSWKPEGATGSWTAWYILCEKCGMPTDVIYEDVSDPGPGKLRFGDASGMAYMRWCPSCGHKFPASKRDFAQKAGKGEPFTYDA